MQQLEVAILANEQWAQKILHENKIDIRTWKLDAYVGDTIGIALSGTNAIYGQVKLVRFEEVDIESFQSEDMQARHHIRPGDYHWYATIAALRNGTRFYAWHFAEQLEYKVLVPITYQQGGKGLHYLADDALYSAEVRKVQAVVGTNAKDATKVGRKAKSKGKTKANVKAKVKAKAKATARAVIEELVAEGLDEKQVMMQARERGVSKSRFSQLRPRVAPKARASVGRKGQAEIIPADHQHIVTEPDSNDAKVQPVMKRPSGAPQAEASPSSSPKAKSELMLQDEARQAQLQQEQMSPTS